MQPRSGTRHLQTSLIALAIFASTAALWSRAARFGFLDYDDQLYVTSNPMVQRGLTPDAVRWAFEPRTVVAGNWHPLTLLSHMLDVQCFGLNPAPHHVHSVLLHAVNTVLLFLVFRGMTGSCWASAATAAVWGWHPLRVESVAWISERKDVLSGLFFFLTLLAYVHYVRAPSWRRYLLVASAMILGLMSKPMLVTLPMVLLLLDVWPLGRWAPNRAFATNQASGDGHGAVRSLGRLVLEKVPLLLISALFSALTLVAQRSAGSVAAVGDTPLWLRANNALQSYVAYLGQAFWPRGLAVLYPLRGRSFTPREAALAGLTLLAITVVVLLLSRRRAFWGVGWFWYLGTLVPVIGLVQVGSQAMADRYTYLPLIGISFALVWCVAALAGRNRFRQFSACASVLLCLALLATCTWRQLAYWRDTKTLFEHALQVTENNYYAHYMVANQFVRQDDFAAAMKHYAAALAIKPNFHEAHYNQGVALMLEGKRLPSAAWHLARALELGHDPAATETALGRCLILLGHVDQAEAHLRRAVQLDPHRSDALTGLGTAWLRQNRAAAAVALYRRALAASGNRVAALPKVAGHLAWIEATNPRETIRNAGEAIKLATAACRATDEQDPQLLDGLAAAEANMGNYARALELSTRAVGMARQWADKEAGFARLAGAIERRIERYQRRRPYRENPSTAELW